MTLPRLSPAAAKAELSELLSAAEELVLAEWTRSASSDSGLSARDYAGSTGLDRIAQLGVALIEYEQDASLKLVVQTLLRIYRHKEGQLNLGTRSAEDLLKAARWQAVILRVFALGASAVFRSHFSVIPNIVLQVPEARYANQHWARATVTALARGEVFQPRSLIPPATDYIADHGVFFHRFRQEKDLVVNSLCQFDFLQCLIVFHATGDDTRSFPNFGVYFKERTEPIIRQLIDGGPARSVLPGVDDFQLAHLIRVLDQSAAHTFFGTAGWELGWSDSRIDDFLGKHGPR